jgi:hypothetical protein
MPKLQFKPRRTHVFFKGVAGAGADPNPFTFRAQILRDAVLDARPR